MERRQFFDFHTQLKIFSWLIYSKLWVWVSSIIIFDYFEIWDGNIMLWNDFKAKYFFASWPHSSNINSFVYPLGTLVFLTIIWVENESLVRY